MCQLEKISFDIQANCEWAFHRKCNSFMRHFSIVSSDDEKSQKTVLTCIQENKERKGVLASTVGQQEDIFVRNFFLFSFRNVEICLSKTISLQELMLENLVYQKGCINVENEIVLLYAFFNALCGCSLRGKWKDSTAQEILPQFTALLSLYI